MHRGRGYVNAMRDCALGLGLVVLSALVLGGGVLLALLTPTRYPSTRIASALPPAHAEQLSANVWHVEGANNTREVYVLHFANETIGLRNRTARATSNYTNAADTCCQFLDFTTNPLGYDVEIRRAPSSGIECAVRRGFALWQPYAPIFNTITSSSAAPAAVFDGTNQVSFGSIDLDSNVIAVTKLYVSIDTGVLLEADQVYNTQDLPIGFGASDYPITTTAIHETGHWVGLKDLYTSACSAYIMTGTIGRGQIKTLDDATIACLGKTPVPEPVDTCPQSVSSSGAQELQALSAKHVAAFVAGAVLLAWEP